MSGLGRAVAAEAAKLRTLPAAPLTVLGTAILAGAIAGALAAQEPPIPAADAVAGAVPLAQAGAILLGVLPVTQEYAGRQLRTSLVAVPSRGAVIAAKTAVAAAASLLAGALATAAALGAAWGAGIATGDGAPDPLAGGGRVLGAALYLALMGLLAHAVALLLRGPVPALTSTLALVLLVSPVLAGLGAFARWLPDRAAAALYLPDAGPGDWLGPAPGALVALAWIVALTALGAWRFCRSEPVP
ncbi:ABC transporter permease [Leucobacter sp. wl10]|uniref:ABC transporter permease n=1 Tax=Leucobacter sp. wl10 TaxID=2304677 RepID=UPI000E5BFA13|nr:ABC transporter permease [Leucobacter sp. wl10]RGE22413.1 ABC transporter permease [Leucobacter sp. wl10]